MQAASTGRPIRVHTTLSLYLAYFVCTEWSTRVRFPTNVKHAMRHSRLLRAADFFFLLPAPGTDIFAYLACLLNTASQRAPGHVLGGVSKHACVMVDDAYVCNMSPSKNGSGSTESFRPTHVLAAMMTSRVT